MSLDNMVILDKRTMVKAVLAMARLADEDEDLLFMG
jgi:hypothetical protein